MNFYFPRVYHYQSGHCLLEIDISQKKYEPILNNICYMIKISNLNVFLFVGNAVLILRGITPSAIQSQARYEKIVSTIIYSILCNFTECNYHIQVIVQLASIFCNTWAL